MSDSCKVESQDLNPGRVAPESAWKMLTRYTSGENFTEISKIGKSRKIKSRLVVVWGWEEEVGRGMRGTANGHGVSFRGDKNDLKIDYGYGYRNL